MGTIVISTNISLDGVAEDPDGQEESSRGGWFAQFVGQDLEAWSRFFTQEAQGAQALLLGRRSDAWFASRWLARDGEWADRLNALPKYVVSSSLVDSQWSNATVLRGDVTTEVARLKAAIDGEIVVYGSGQLTRALIDSDLVDELRLVVFPVVLGAGDRLFGDTGGPKPLRLLGQQPIGAGLVLLSYAVVRRSS